MFELFLFENLQLPRAKNKKNVFFMRLINGILLSFNKLRDYILNNFNKLKKKEKKQKLKKIASIDDKMNENIKMVKN